MANLPITSGAQMAGVLQQQLADIAQQKSVLIAAQADAIAQGLGPTYSISSPDGSKTVGMLEYVSFLGSQVAAYLALEMEILEALQNLQPFEIRQNVRIGGYFTPGYGHCGGSIL